MMAAKARFLLFCLIVLALPGGLMALDDPRVGDLGKLAMILSPALAGLVLNWGLGKRDGPIRWREVGLAGLITLSVAGLALAVALLAGAAGFSGQIRTPPDAATLIGATLLTSVLEELGWAGGGLALALKAFGRRIGVLILGLVWAAWHLIPTFLKVGLFPDLEAAPPLMLVVFVIACLIYRELLTRFVERSGSWLGAAAGHAAPNVLLTAFVAFSGLVVLQKPEAWPLFPAPGGVVFAALALAAVWLLIRRNGASRAAPAG
jgi:membrane protease YdiL (CAAX protease family)